MKAQIFIGDLDEFYLDAVKSMPPDDRRIAVWAKISEAPGQSQEILLKVCKTYEEADSCADSLRRAVDVLLGIKIEIIP